ncbi:uncharacterized protein DUF2510 [Jatrophihabitans sp. GAS493]|uniref:DUF2510 domain-containing protein n=1 Tax=Jatrophihabitans sp. GAS493 TaxID=1907575 RepID=UPI000BB7A1BE|nr:DUF2510 domain-containing protein [Jatrophihabitans sp. GAS493]SOD73998.1 uncharacterized protein DUF2510 [Jatrophihabitans sp. GAS493]
MAIPGWYPDATDPAYLRYFDGNAWTADRQPIPTGAPVSPPVEMFQPQLLQHGPYEQSENRYETHYAGAYPNQYQMPAYPAAFAPPPFAPPPPAAVAGRRSRARVFGSVAVVTLLVAGLLTGGWWFFIRSNAPTLTYQGKSIDQPAQVLNDAQAKLSNYVVAHHGNKSREARCYFALDKVPAADARTSDVDHRTFCGPVLFAEGDTSQEYLAFELTPPAPGATHLSVSASPMLPDAESVPATERLVRPDSKRPPKGSGGISVPAPPKAAANIIVSTDLGTQTLPDAPAKAVIGSLSGGVRLTVLGKVSHFGTGANSFGAPDGQQLYAFQTAAASGQEGDEDLSSKLGISIDGDRALPLPPTTYTDYYVVAAPVSAKSVDLVLNDAGAMQTVSLLDGSPARTNVALALRVNTEVTIGKSAGIPIHYAYAGQSASSTLTTTFTSASLFYWDTSENDETPPATNLAYLYVEMTYSSPDDAAGGYGWPPEYVTVTPAGGSPIRGKNMSSDPKHRIYDLFVVPANFTTGTLTIAGAKTEDGVTGTVVTPYRLTLSFPPG